MIIFTNSIISSLGLHALMGIVPIVNTVQGGTKQTVLCVQLRQEITVREREIGIDLLINKTILKYKKSTVCLLHLFKV